LGFLVPEARLSGSGSFRHPRQERDGAADDLTARLDDPSERPQTNGYRTPQQTLVTAAVINEPEAPYNGIRHPDARWLISISATRFESWRVLRPSFVLGAMRGW
jgi:hypothetical protein